MAAKQKGSWVSRSRSLFLIPWADWSGTSGYFRRRKIDNTGRQLRVPDLQARDSDRQPKAPRAGAAGIDEQYALSFANQGPVGMTGNDRSARVGVGRLIQ